MFHALYEVYLELTLWSSMAKLLEMFFTCFLAEVYDEMIVDAYCSLLLIM
jgi:hypothetical protein